ncbi:hypothetical protein [Legionella saoudiensis]|uniref:hypothetical protein n=1 Tax=Legionella saoudiensis TaxID=1750561 RepID=UPI0007315ECB|nr:hypothetical protein [Legionella saoudiensis]
MPIISGSQAQIKEKLKVEIHADILEQIQKYCEWASINDLGFFIEEASRFVFAKDKEWKKQQKVAKKSKQETT